MRDPVRQLYDQVARHYDGDTGREDYQVWVGLYLDLIARHGAPGQRLADLGCGTGKASIVLAGAGFEVTGIDLSPAMIEAARAKPGSERVRYATGDLRDLPDLGPFDVAVTVGEPLCYLSGPDELAAAFAGVARLLAPGGLFVFDNNTRGFYRRLARRVELDDSRPGMVVVWQGRVGTSDPRGAELRVHRFASSDGVSWARAEERHAFSFFPPALVRRLLAGAGLTLAADYGLFRGVLHPGADQERDRKSLLVARKEGPA